MLFSIVVVPIYIPTNSVGGFHFLHTLSSILICRLFNDGHFDRCEVILRYSFDLHFSNNLFFKAEFLKLHFFFTLVACFFFFNFYLFIYFWQCWVFVSVRGLSLVVASGGHSSSRCAGLSLSRPLLLRSTGSRRAGSVVVAHETSRSAACGIFPDQGSNLCPLHRQADSQPLRHQGSPLITCYVEHLSCVYWPSVCNDP